MKKKLYWKVETSAGVSDVSVICKDILTVAEIIKNDFESIDEGDKKETEYKITPVWYTDKQYAALPESDNY